VDGKYLKIIEYVVQILFKIKLLKSNKATVLISKSYGLEKVSKVTTIKIQQIV
jgi:hypothetical protein